LRSAVSSYSVQYSNTIISQNGTNIVQVAEVISHEYFNRENDIGLVRLAEPITNPLNDFKVRLPTSGSYFETGTPAVLAGWGLNATDGTLQSNLQKVDLQIFSAYDCNKIHRDKVHYTNICGGVPEGMKGQVSYKENYCESY
jgi:trypsin